MVAIPQKDPTLLYWLRDWFGGSIGSASKSGCQTLNICGDRARLFVAQIYERLTPRRKAQVDATGALDVFGGVSFVNLSVDELRARMLAYYEEHFETTEKNPVIRRKRQNERYRQGMENPEFKEEVRKRSQRQRDRMTPEQKEAARQYQREYFQKKKTNSKLLLIEKSA